MANAHRIDVHTHMIPDFYRQAAIDAGAVPAQGRYPNWSPELALKMMEANDIATLITSVAYPGFLFGSLDEAARLARRCNEFAVEIGEKWPGRFGGFASLPIQDPFDLDRGREEIAYALDTLKMDGVMLFASYGEKFLGDAVFDPLMEELNRRSAVVFIHPTYHPSSKKIDLPFPGFLVEYLFDTTRAAVNMLYADTLGRYPNIKFILAHAGGTLPYISWRVAVSPTIDRRLPQWSIEEVYAKLRLFWYDTALSPTASTMGSLQEVAAPDRILFATDWPMAGETGTVESVRNLAALDIGQERHAAINRGNALKLFPKYAR
ncbi:Amidohydrolase [Pigmentiphaga humi]|uniref:Amidohydrolase n=1 Tax=Pigmentiphaga humi TaxID=2478468 RepID=A0A3P4B4V0_9BURK|nr:amidohydrolase family protein [Pigmentiphaga humi]VCU70185.1 Amidohydrolase [Pigmentiphaga humi]